MVHLSNEMPPEYDETEFSNAARPLVETSTSRTFSNWEVTNIEHDLHAHNATQVKYHSRILVDDGEFLVVIFIHDKTAESQLIEVRQGQTLESTLA